jgi:predicted ester cyclase
MRHGLYLLLLTTLTTPALALETYCEGHEDLLARYLKMSEVLFNGARDESRAGEFYAEKFRSPDQDVRQSGDADSAKAQPTGPERMQRVIRMYKNAFPQRELINETIICSGEFVTARVRIKGVMTGPLGDYAPTGRAFEYRAIDIYRFNAQGKVFERWGVADRGQFFTEAGLLQEVPGVRRESGE